MLAMTGVGLGFVATQGSKYQGATVLAVGAADAMCLVVAIVVLLITVRPVHLDTMTAEGWSRWAPLKPETLHEHMRADLRAERGSFLSRTVMIKFRRLRRGRRAVPDSCQVMRGTTGNGGEHLPTGPAPLAAPPMVSPGLARQRPELPKLWLPLGRFVSSSTCRLPEVRDARLDDMGALLGHIVAQSPEEANHGRADADGPGTR